MSDEAGYGPAWAKLTVMVHPGGDVHVVDGESDGEGEGPPFAGEEVLRARLVPLHRPLENGGKGLTFEEAFSVWEERLGQIGSVKGSEVLLELRTLLAIARSELAYRAQTLSLLRKDYEEIHADKAVLRKRVAVLEHVLSKNLIRLADVATAARGAGALADDILSDLSGAFHGIGKVIYFETADGALHAASNDGEYTPGSWTSGTCLNCSRPTGEHIRKDEGLFCPTLSEGVVMADELDSTKLYLGDRFALGGGSFEVRGTETVGLDILCCCRCGLSLGSFEDRASGEEVAKAHLCPVAKEAIKTRCYTCESREECPMDAQVHEDDHVGRAVPVPPNCPKLGQY